MLNTGQGQRKLRFLTSLGKEMVRTGNAHLSLLENRIGWKSKKQMNSHLSDILRSVLNNAIGLFPN